ncbi:MAG: hypothetical protein O3A63_21825 [Proteobacteria bacterium]|nr:hypothetical protein [Pseudomonadota bacterium]
MNGYSILTPVFVMWLLTLVVWVYLYARRIPFLHSAVHATINIVLLRFSLYAISALALWVMVVRITVDHFMN